MRLCLLNYADTENPARCNISFVIFDQGLRPHGAKIQLFSGIFQDIPIFMFSGPEFPK